MRRIFMDFLTFFIDRGAVSGAFHTSTLLVLTRHCLHCLGVIWSAGMLRQKPGSTQINRAFCPERCVEGYSFPSTLRVRKQTLSQTTFYLHGHRMLLFSNSVLDCEWVQVFPAANFVLFLPDGRVVHLENRTYFLPRAQLFCYLVILVFVVVLQAKNK